VLAILASQAVNAIKIMKHLKRCNKFEMYDYIASRIVLYCIEEENIAMPIYCCIHIVL